MPVTDRRIWFLIIYPEIIEPQLHGSWCKVIKIHVSASCIDRSWTENTWRLASFVIDSPGNKIAHLFKKFYEFMEPEGSSVPHKSDLKPYSSTATTSLLHKLLYSYEINFNIMFTCKYIQRSLIVRWFATTCLYLLSSWNVTVRSKKVTLFE
jgi:hypothetical protein